jgi:hypothetical protein
MSTWRQLIQQLPESAKSLSKDAEDSNIDAWKTQARVLSEEIYDIHHRLSDLRDRPDNQAKKATTPSRGRPKRTAVTGSSNRPRPPDDEMTSDLGGEETHIEPEET